MGFVTLLLSLGVAGNIYSYIVLPTWQKTACLEILAKICLILGISDNFMPNVMRWTAVEMRCKGIRFIYLVKNGIKNLC